MNIINIIKKGAKKRGEVIITNNKHNTKHREKKQREKGREKKKIKRNKTRSNIEYSLLKFHSLLRLLIILFFGRRKEKTTFVFI